MSKAADSVRHVLVPKHVKLSDSEKEALLKRYSIAVEALPKIMKDDAAVVDLSAKLGDVIKIVRHSPTAGEAVFYRVVSNA
ncbi:DNA-directed RNA polymerase subunit H [Candidatus Woesearchaeota archaeon]|nr:DNA-directed RNA polymerase subunit H [Candidatus Woesearchaeota archaeon]